MIDMPEQISGVVAALFVDMKPEILGGSLIAFGGALTFILILSRQKKWNDFLARNKWSSRFILFILSLFIVVPALFIPANGMAYLLPGRLAMESPNLTATAIKLGLYSLYRDYEISNRVPPEERGLVKCVVAVSNMEARNFQAKCNDNQTCFANIPVMNRETIIAKIMEVSRSPSSEAYSACKNIDASKIN